MKKNYYIFKNGNIKRKDNSLTFITTEEDKINIPINTVSDLYIFGKTTLNTDLLEFLNSLSINIHFFDYYNNMIGSYISNNIYLAGDTIIKQVNLINTDRLKIASKFVLGAFYGMRSNLLEYKIELDDRFNETKLIEYLSKKNTIQELMGVEGNYRKYYYSKLDLILKKYKFIKRSKRPPENEINCLISFGNVLCYTECLKAIRRTQLNTTISYLHDCGHRRHSLSLDLAEIFKPIYVDRVIFNMVNNNMLNGSDFIKMENSCFLSESGKKKFVKKWEEKLSTVIYNRNIDRNCTYREMIIFEAYKLLKMVLENKEYEPLKIWW